MGKRGGATEEGEHEAREVELVGELARREPLEVAPWLEEIGARPLRRRVDGVRAGGVGRLLPAPGDDPGILEDGEVFKRPEGPGRGRVAVARREGGERADRAEIVVAGLWLAVDEDTAVGSDRARLRLEAPGVHRQPTGEDHRRQHAAEKDEERSLDELHPRRRHHPRGDDDQRHRDADEDHPDRMGKAQQRHDQVAGAHHLRNEIEDAHDERRDRHRQLDATAVVFRVESIGKGELPQRLDRLGDHEQRHDPAGEKSDRVEEAVEAMEGDHPADAEEARRREVIAGEGDPVDEPVNLAVGGVVALGRLPLPPQPERQADDGKDETGEDRDRDRR